MSKDNDDNWRVSVFVDGEWHEVDLSLDNKAIGDASNMLYEKPVSVDIEFVYHYNRFDRLAWFPPQNIPELS